MKLLYLVAVLAAACLVDAVDVQNNLRILLSQLLEKELNEKELESLERSTKPETDIAVLGQTGSGKTTLTSAITKVQSEKGLAKFRKFSEIDIGQEEKAWGVTIRTSHVEYETETRKYNQIDCPTNTDILKNMISKRLYGAIVVVSAVDGVGPETSEQLHLALKFGINKIVVFLNKADLVNDKNVAVDEGFMRGFLDGAGFDGDNTPVIIGSALKALEGKDDWKANIEELLGKMDYYIPIPKRAKDEDFMMPVEDVFQISGRGTVATGRIKLGIVNVGETVEGLGLNKDFKTTVTGVEMFRKILDTGVAGDNVGLLLQGTTREEIERGMVLAKPGAYKTYTTFEAEVYVLTTDEGGTDAPFIYQSLQFFFNVHVTGIFTLLDGIEMVIPGDVVPMQVKLYTPIMMVSQETRFAIQDNGPTIAIGVVTKGIK